jgi:hypothetical protein
MILKPDYSPLEITKNTVLYLHCGKSTQEADGRRKYYGGADSATASETCVLSRSVQKNPESRQSLNTKTTTIMT